MTDALNIGEPTVCNRAFVALALEAGIETTIVSLIPLAIDLRSLLIAIKEAIEGSNPELADALNIDNLREILAFIMRKNKSPIKFAPDLPYQLNENGPTSVTAARDGGDPTIVNVTFSEPEVGQTFTRYALYLDSIFEQTGQDSPVGGYINEQIEDVPDDGLTHNVRVLWFELNYDPGDGSTIPEAISLFGPVAYFS